MDAYECIATKLDIREFATKAVPSDVKRKVLEAARLTASAFNYQYWRFVLVQEKENIAKLADHSKTGKWVAGADFAVIVLTDPKYSTHLFDAGKVSLEMQLAAWSFGVASGIYTGMDKEAMARDFEIPRELNPTVVVGFGYPTRRILGRKNRKPLTELAFYESYGKRLEVWAS